jgi:hypothetical protein
MKTNLIGLSLLLLITSVLWSQSKRDDIPVAKLPKEDKVVLDQYVKALNAPDLDTCAVRSSPSPAAG